MLTLVTAPVGAPLTVDEAKAQVHQGDPIDDEILNSMILAATERCEIYTGRQMLTATWQLKLDRFPSGSCIELPKAPLVSVSSVQYVDTAGDTQTWAAANYKTEIPSGPRARRGRLALAFGKTWPSTYGEIADVTIEFAYTLRYNDAPPQNKR